MTLTKYNFHSTDERKSIKLLPKYKCRICEKFKHPAGFSKRELNTYTNSIVNRIPVTAISARLRCRECSGNQVSELQCEGPCGTWKDLESFSKNQRGGGAHWCMECVMWKEAQEPGVLTRAAPNHELDADEVTQHHADSDPEGDGDTDEDDPEVPLPYHPTRSARTRSLMEDIPSNSRISRRAIRAQPGSVPPHLQSEENMSVVADGQSTVSNPYEGQDTVSTVSGWTAADARRRTFNAYDPSGNLHVQRHPASTVGLTPSTSEISQQHQQAPTVPQNQGRWAKVPGYKQPTAARLATQRRPVPTLLPPTYDSDDSHDSA
ncbi:hypothetical protein B7463_g10306, partial [Scytalidium lignicola]